MHMPTCVCTFRPGFDELINRSFTNNENSSTTSTSVHDIYDGRVWKKFMTNKSTASHHFIALALNVDWFQMYKHSTKSSGGVYITILNLPSQFRYSRENMILVSVL